jgi:aminoglycoside 3-N-acetyltransferase
MAEKDTIDYSQPAPLTIPSLVSQFQKLPVPQGVPLLVHSSFSSLGWIAGGALAVIEGLVQFLGSQRTLVMPTHTGNLSDPADWENPPVPESWWPYIRETMPAFQPDKTPTWGMGAIPELFRTLPGVIRSTHPWASFAALGPESQFILQDQKLDFSMDDYSPLGRLYQSKAWVMLLGVDYSSNTCFHLAEYRTEWPKKKIFKAYSPCAEPFFKERTWASFNEIDFDSDDFPQIGQAFEQTGKVQHYSIGKANVRVFSLVDAVDFACKWIREHRTNL